jgi:hypothetical protein
MKRSGWMTLLAVLCFAQRSAAKETLNQCVINCPPGNSSCSQCGFAQFNAAMASCYDGCSATQRSCFDAAWRSRAAAPEKCRRRVPVRLPDVESGLVVLNRTDPQQLRSHDGQHPFAGGRYGLDRGCCAKEAADAAAAHAGKLDAEEQEVAGRFHDERSSCSHSVKATRNHGVTGPSHTASNYRHVCR